MSTFRDFRIVEAHKNSSIAHDPDGRLHLVEHERNFKTLCQMDVASRTMIPLECFGNPDPEFAWCLCCRRKLAYLREQAEESGKKNPKRKKYKVTPPDAIHKLVLLVVELGIKQVEAAAIVGITENTACIILKRLREKSAISGFCQNST